jgi:hypothetical protein
MFKTDNDGGMRAMELGHAAALALLFVLGGLEAALILSLAVDTASVSGSFWCFLAASVVVFLAISRRRGWARWKTALGALAVIPASLLAMGLWWLLFVDGPLFNLFAPLTNEFRTYRAECQGWVYRFQAPGGLGVCFGYYKRALGGITYKVDVARQKVWIWHDPIAFLESEVESEGGWVTSAGHVPDEKLTCEVSDYKNWTCIDSDARGTDVTEMVGGVEYDDTLGQNSLIEKWGEEMARCDVQIDALTYWLLRGGEWKILPWHRLRARRDWSGNSHKGRSWIDCRKPPP